MSCQPMIADHNIKAQAVGPGASGTQLNQAPIVESGQEQEQIIQDSKSEKEKEVAGPKEKLALVRQRLKEKDKAYNEQETIKLRLEEELTSANKEITFLKKRIDSSKELEKKLKEKISELEKEMNEKVEELQDKEARIKHREENLSEKEKSVFNAEGIDAADKRDRELMIKQVKDLKKESKKNIAEATQRIDELEETHKEQLKEIKKLREENITLKGTVVEQENMKEKLTELEASRDKVAASYEEKIDLIRREEETKCAKMKHDFAKATNHIDELEKTHKEQLKEINRLKEENIVLKNELFKQDFESERKDRERIKGQLINLQEKRKEAQIQFHNLKQSNGTLVHDLEESRKEIESLVQKNAQLEKQHNEEIRKIKKKLKELEAGETDRIKGIEEEMQVLTAQVNAYSREVDKQKGLVTRSQEKHKTEVNELNERLDEEIKSKQQLNNELAEMRQELDSVSKKHETETSELQEKSRQQVQQFQQMIQGANEKLENERKSKKQLDSELAKMRQELANVSADKEELLRAYDQEQVIVTTLKNEVETTKKANKVLKDKLLNLQQLITPSATSHIQLPAPHGAGGFQHASHPLPTTIGTRHNIVPSAQVSGGSKQVVQSDGDGNGDGVLILPKTEQTATTILHPDSNPDDTPLLSKEEMTKMFKWHDQQGSSDWTQSPQQVEDSLVKEKKRKELAKEADDAVLEVERLRQNVKKPSSFPMEKLPPPSQQTSSKQKTKQKVKKDQAKQRASDDSESDIEENKLIDNIDEEIQQMAEDVRKGSRGPTTAEVLFDDGDSSLPYDPNLVCPKCGKQYRVGEIQKLRRHINEFCTGIR
uniref:Uncharacterized protein n=2 Tax=Amphimedon queenslandica TaxID=400682 RepID=A0A1X7T232_AMPQE